MLTVYQFTLLHTEILHITQIKVRFYYYFFLFRNTVERRHFMKRKKKFLPTARICAFFDHKRNDIESLKIENEKKN